MYTGLAKLFFTKHDIKVLKTNKKQGIIIKNLIPWSENSFNSPHTNTSIVLFDFPYIQFSLFVQYETPSVGAEYSVPLSEIFPFLTTSLAKSIVIRETAYNLVVYLSRFLIWIRSVLWLRRCSRLEYIITELLSNLLLQRFASRRTIWLLNQLICSIIN